MSNSEDIEQGDRQPALLGLPPTSLTGGQDRSLPAEPTRERGQNQQDQRHTLQPASMQEYQVVQRQQSGGLFTQQLTTLRFAEPTRERGQNHQEQRCTLQPASLQ